VKSLLEFAERPAAYVGEKYSEDLIYSLEDKWRILQLGVSLFTSSASYHQEFRAGGAASGKNCAGFRKLFVLRSGDRQSGFGFICFLGSSKEQRF
jgi:hypothetical protein